MEAEAFLSPPIEPYVCDRVALDDVHEMYWEECGNPNGVPVVLLHGGPGAGAFPIERRFFDPSVYRIVVLDQRGSGRSVPFAETSSNTTDYLISDIEFLRSLRGIDKWLVFGGSWGSTLALAYGEAHPERCLGLVLRGVFLGERDEIDWFLYGLARFAPGEWNDFVSILAPSERGDILNAYRERLNNPDPSIRMNAALTWIRYEAMNLTLVPSADTIARFEDRALSLARIEAHYFANDCFLQPEQLLRNSIAIASIPCIIVQGKYDLLSPMRSAYRLHEALSASALRVVPSAGHSALEPAISRELVAATRDILTNFGVT